MTPQAIRIGKLEPRFSFVLNPFVDSRFNQCPRCQGTTARRKFPLFIHVENWRPFVLGKTCRFCSRCELIITHKDEIDAQLAHALKNAAPDAVGSKYLVVGTMQGKAWRQGLTGGERGVTASLEHVADFKEVLTLRVE
jgi:hypothetical protein